MLSASSSSARLPSSASFARISGLSRPNDSLGIEWKWEMALEAAVRQRNRDARIPEDIPKMVSVNPPWNLLLGCSRFPSLFRRRRTFPAAGSAGTDFRRDRMRDAPESEPLLECCALSSTQEASALDGADRVREKLSPAICADALATPSGPDAVCSEKLELVEGISPSPPPSSMASPEPGSSASSDMSIAVSSEDGADCVREKGSADLAIFAAALSSPFRMAHPGSIKVKDF